MPLQGVAALQPQATRWLIAPLALQGLLENAVKHNQASRAEPLVVVLTLADGHVVMRQRRCGRGAARCRRPAWAWSTWTSAAGC
jgi:LytS/YehU family sensor histidine kinase